jgi:hypothetical protein
MDHNSHRHRDERTAPTPTVEDLIGEIDRDPSAVFWG